MKNFLEVNGKFLSNYVFMFKISSYLMPTLVNSLLNFSQMSNIRNKNIAKQLTKAIILKNKGKHFFFLEKFISNGNLKLKVLLSILIATKVFVYQFHWQRKTNNLRVYVCLILIRKWWNYNFEPWSLILWPPVTFGQFLSTFNLMKDFF